MGLLVPKFHSQISSRRCSWLVLTSRCRFSRNSTILGRLNASDFVHSTDPAIIIQNQTFPHLLHHFVLTYSNWEAGTVYL